MRAKSVSERIQQAMWEEKHKEIARRRQEERESVKVEPSAPIPAGTSLLTLAPGLPQMPGTGKKTNNTSQPGTEEPAKLTSAEIKSRMDAREAEWQKGVPADIQAKGDRLYKSRYDDLISRGVDSLIAETEAGKARQDYFLDASSSRGQEKAKMAGEYYNAKVEEAEAALAANSKAAQAFEDLYRLDDLTTAAMGILAIAERGGAPISEWQSAADTVSDVLGLTVEGAGGFEQYAQQLREFMHTGIATRRAADEQAVVDAGLDLELLKEARERQSKAEQAQARREVIEQETKKDPFGMNAVSVLLSPIQGVEYVSQLLGNIGHNDTDDLDNYRPMDVHNMPLTESIEQVRGETAENINNKVLAWLYNNGMSIADSTAQIAALGPASVFVMGGSAAASQMKDVLERGGTNRQAMLSGAAAGAAEMLFEKVSIDNLLAQKSVTGWKSWLAETAKQAGLEASEETVSEVANILSDAAIMGDNSDFARNVSNYTTQGYTQNEAKKKAFLDSVGQVALAAAGGALSGGVMGGAVNAVNGVQKAKTAPANRLMEIYDEIQAQKGEAASPAVEGTDIPTALAREIRNAGPAIFDSITPAEASQTAQDAPETPVGVQVIEDVLDGRTRPTGSTAQSQAELSGEGQKNSAPEGGKNIRMTNADESEYIQTGNRPQVIAVKQAAVNSGEKIVLTSQEETRNYIHGAISGETKGVIPKAYGKVGSSMANDVYAKSNGTFDVEGWYLELIPSDLRHAFLQHSDAKQNGNIPLEEKDFLNIPDYIDTYDDILECKTFSNGEREIVLGKKINGYSVIVEIVSKSRKSLSFKNMWGVDTPTYEAKYKNNTEYRPSRSSEIANGSTRTHNDAVLNSTVPQSTPAVNPQFEEQGTPEDPGQRQGEEGDAGFRNIGAAERGFATPTQGETVDTQNKTMNPGADISRKESKRYAPGTHERVSEEMSLERALGQFYQGDNGGFVNLEDTVDTLLEKENWSGADQDAAQIAFRWMNAHKDSLTDEQYSRFWALHRAIEEIGGTEAGRSLQARQKWVESGDGIVSKSMSLMDDPRINREAARRVIKHVQDLAKKYDRAVADKNNIAFAEIVRECAVERNTTKVRENGQIKKTAEWAIQQILQHGDVDFMRQAARSSIIAMAQDYVPQSATAKLKAVRRDAMLSKISTWARNVVSNNVFDPIDSIARDISVPMDMLLSNFTHTRSVNWDASWFSKAKREGTKYGLARSFLEVSLDISAEGAESKYGQAGNRTFKTTGNLFERFMSQWEKISNYAMYSTDQMQKGGIEAEIQRGIDKLYDTDKIADDSLRDAGEQEATYRTFQEDSGLSRGLSAIRQGLNRMAHVGDMGLGDVLMPFVQVPANLVDITVDYSPVGMARGLMRLTDTLIDAKNGTMTAAQQARAVQTIGRSLTGTGVLALAVLAKMSGALLISDDGRDEDKDKAALESQANLSGTQINLSGIMRLFKGGSAEKQSGDVLMSIGFLDPLNALLNMGGLIADDYVAEHEGEDNGITFGEVVQDSLAGTAQAVKDLPMMDPLFNFFDNYNYSTSDTIGGRIADAAGQYAAGQVTSLIPNNIKGIAQGTDPMKRDLYSGQTLREQTKDSVMAAIPGLRERLPVKQDSFGEEMESGNPVLNFLNNNVLPGSIVQYQPRNEVIEQWLDYLFDTTGSVTQYPDKTPPNSISKDTDGDGRAEKFALSAEEKRQYKETYGNILIDLYDQLRESQGTLTPEELVDIASNIKSYAGSQAKQEYFNAHSINAEASTNSVNKAVQAIEEGITLGQYYQLKDKHDEIDKGPGSANDKMTEWTHYLDSQGLTSKQVAKMTELMGYSTIMPVREAEHYLGLKENGLSADKAEKIFDAVSAKEPDPGKTQISDDQRADAILSVKGLSISEQLKALKEYYKADSKVSLYEKYERAYNEMGISPKTYCQYRQNKASYNYDVDEKGSRKVKEGVINIIDAMDLSKEQKQWLYDLEGYKGEVKWN